VAEKKSNFIPRNLAIKKKGGGEYLARIFPFKNLHFWRSFVPTKKKKNADIASQKKRRL
jgi:hypothetical protein